MGASKSLPSANIAAEPAATRDRRSAVRSVPLSVASSELSFSLPSSNSLRSAARVSVVPSISVTSAPAAARGSRASFPTAKKSTGDASGFRVYSTRSQKTPAAYPVPSRAMVAQVSKKAKIKITGMATRAVAKRGTQHHSASAKSKKVCSRNSVNRAKPCEHGKRATRCPDCIKQSGSGTRSLCAHLKQKGWCIECKKDGILYYGETRGRGTGSIK